MMNSDFEKKYKRIIKELNSLNEIGADKSLVNKITLLAEQNVTTKNHLPNFLLTRAAFFTIILVLLTGGGGFASEKISPGTIVNPIKEAASQIQISLKKDDSAAINSERDEDGNEKKQGQNTNQGAEDENLQKPSNQEWSPDEKSDASENESQNPTLTPTPTKNPTSVLGEAGDKLPEPAKGIVEGVTERLENSQPIKNSQQGSEEVVEDKKDKQGNEISGKNNEDNKPDTTPDIPDNPGGQNENDGSIPDNIPSF